MSYKVLIVDDSKLARMTVINALYSLRPQWLAFEVSDPNEAIAVVESVQPNIAIIDVNMHGKDGLTLLGSSARYGRRCR